MRKVIILFLGIVMCTTVFASCDENTIKESGENPYELSNFFTLDAIESFDNVSMFVPEEHTSFEPTESETGEESNPMQGFLAMDKKYSFKGNDIMIVSLKNQTDVNYAITVNGSFYDSKDNLIKTVTQTFDQFASGYQHYFLFQPEITFEKFTYTIDASETDAPMYVNDIELVFSGLQEAKWPVDELVEQGDHTFYPVIQSMFGYRNKSKDQSLKLKAIGTVILLNEQDKIVAIYGMGSTLTPKNHVDYYTKQIYYTTNETLVWPEELQGEIRAIHATLQVYKADS